MLQLIHKIHWGEAQPVDPPTLQYAADRWGRTRVGRNGKALDENSLSRIGEGRTLRRAHSSGLTITGSG